MRLPPAKTSGLSLLCLLALAGCGPREADVLQQARAEVANPDAATARVRLNSLVQRLPKSAEAHLLLGQRLLVDGEAAAAAAELQRALDLGHPAVLALPDLADALLLAGKATQVQALQARAPLANAAATARLLATVAQSWAQQGDLLKARQAVAQALAASPTSPPALVMQARLAAQAGDTAAALATLDGLLAAHADSHPAWVLKAELLLREPTPANRRAALAAYTQALALRPQALPPAFAVLALQLAEGDTEGARQRLEQVKKLAPKHPQTLLFDALLAARAGEHGRARDLYQALLGQTPDNLTVLLASGDNAMQMGAWLQAETAFARALTLAPGHGLARQGLATVQLRQGQAAKALATVAPLLDAPDASPAVVALAARAQLLNGDARAAHQLFGRLATLKPADPQLRTLVAVAGLGQGRDAEVFTTLGAIADADTDSTADLALVSELLQRNRTEAALTALSRLQAKRPKEALAPLLRGQVLAARHDGAGARQAFEQALQIDAKSTAAVAALAGLDQQDGHADRARQRLTDWVQAQPANARARLVLAELLTRQHAPAAQVLEQLTAAAKASPSDRDVHLALITHHHQAGHTDAALAAAQAATTALPDDADLIALLGRCQMQARQMEQALSSYGKLVALHPRSPRGHVGLADVYLQAGALDLAQQSVGRALALAPGLPEAQGQAAIIRLRQGDADGALRIAREMQARQPDDAAGLLLEAEVERGRGRWEPAASALRKALAKAPDSTAAVKLHHVLVRAGKTSEAEAWAQQWRKSHPDDTTLVFYLADAAQQRGDLAQADALYQQVLAAQPDHALALNNQAMLHLRQGQPDALALAQRAVQLAPGQAALLDTLAAVLAAQQQLPRAIEVQRQAVALSPDEGAWRLALARYELQAGNKPAAKAELDRLARLGPRFAQQAEVARLQASLNATVLGR